MRSIGLAAIIITGLLFSPSSLANENPSLLPRCGQTDFNMCGYIDAEVWERETREHFVIEPIFENANRFSEGMAAVRINGKYGYLDSSGQIVIRSQFERAGFFDQGLAVVASGNKLGIIDRSGNFVIDPIFGKAAVFSNEVILAQSAGTSGKNNRAVPHEPISTPYNFSPLNDAGLYHIHDGWLTKQIYSFERFEQDKRELIWAQVQFGRPGDMDDPYGLMSSDGSWLIEPKYTYGIDLKNDRAPVRIIKNGKSVSGAIDGKGREVIPFKYDYLTHWEGGFLKAGKGDYPNRRFGIVNKNGDLLGNRYFDEIKSKERFDHDDTERDNFSVRDGDEWKTLLKDGTILSDQRVGDVFLKCDQYVIFYSENGYELKPNDKRLPFITFERPLFSFSKQKCNPPPTLVRGETYASLLENGSVFAGFVENSGSFFVDHLWVKKNGKWGLINESGQYAIAPMYDSVMNEKGYAANEDLPTEQSDSTFKAYIDDEAFRISYVNGEYTQSPFTELETTRSQTLVCKGGYNRKSKDGLWGIVDKNGDYLIPPNYRAISCFGNGIAWVPDDVKRQWCPIDRDGLPRSAPSCENHHYSSWISHHMPEKLHDDPYESNVLWERARLDYGEGRRDNEPKMIPDGYGWGVQ